MDNSRKLDLNLVLFGILGVFLSRLSIGNLVFTLPLLFMAPRVDKPKKLLYTFAAMLVLIVASIVLEYSRMLDASNRAYIVFALVFPVTSVVCSAVWTGMGSRTDSFLRKLFVSLMPAFITGLGTGLWLTTPSAMPALETLKEAMGYVIPLDSIPYDISPLLSMVFSLLAMTFSVMTMVISIIPLVLSELSIHRYDEKWQFDFAYLKLPEYFLWVFLGSWALVLLSNFTDFLPSWGIVVVCNTALAVSLFFMMQGLSIVAAFIRRRNAYIRAGRVVFWAVFLMIIPGINFVVFLGLPVLGVLETWVKLR